MPTPSEYCVVVSSEQSGRLLTLLLRLGFTAERIGRSQLRINGCTIDEVHCFALLFDIRVLQLSAGPPDRESSRVR